ncbi:MAG: signal peptidase II [Rhizobiales bacterium]|nr:signal peptidase II [Hyphomicrobiales bacterium]MBA67644.1 signal peptidase II [Hyphomicrobiales bacterium]|tara:strand:- start:1747 stop:2256 length:510 start_codon:yes stop_codon:yes gene_type:complete
MSGTRVARLPGFIIGLIAAVALDQFIKYLVEKGLPMHERVDLIPVLSLFRTYNDGIAFSMLAGLGDTGLALIAAVVIVFVLYLRARTDAHRHFAHWGYCIIIGGAIGNLIDRVWHGYVIDYILFHTESWSFAVFNLADAFISVGAAFVVLDEFLDWRSSRGEGAGDGNA